MDYYVNPFNPGEKVVNKILLLCALFLCNLQFASANIFYHGQYRIGLFKDSSLDTEKITHVILVGSAVKEDSDQFFQSGVGRAQRYKELWPDHQIVFLSSPEVNGKNDQEVFDSFNITVVKIIKETFTGDQLIHELNAFTKIASIDFYGHSSPWGFKLGKWDAAFDPSAHTKSLVRLRKNFTPNAYINISGCSSGFVIAPELSRALELPVSGSLTSSVFERIAADGLWYKETDLAQENYIEVNNKSFNENTTCSSGSCWRMKPSRFNYSSYWGVFKEGGLSFFKFFCNFDNNSDGHCEKGMAKSLLSFPSVHPITENSTEQEFKEVAFDWLCSTAADKNYFKKCVLGIEAAITRGDLVFQTHPGNELICDFKSCKAKIICKEKTFGSGLKGGSCKLEAETNTRPTTAARELQSFLTGFRNIKK